MIQEGFEKIMKTAMSAPIHKLNMHVICLHFHLGMHFCDFRTCKQLVRVPNVSWEPIDRLPVLEFLLPGDNPADIFFKTFHEVNFFESYKEM